AHAEGVAVARYILDRGATLLGQGSPRRVAALVLPSPAASAAPPAARLAGLEETLRSPRVQLVCLPPGTASTPTAVRPAIALPRSQPFADALVAPWRDDAPAAGDPLFTFLSPRLPSLTPLQAIGGHAPGGTFFESRTWNRVSTKVYGPAL